MGRIHARNLAQGVAGARLVKVADALASAAKRAGQDFGVAAETSLDAVLEDPEVDAIIIATPPRTHPQAIVRAAASRKPMLCEKPLAYDLEEAERAVAAARSAGVQLQMGFHRRFDPSYVAAKARVAAGALGSLQLFFTSMRDKHAPPDDVLRRERLLFDATSHDFDAARWLVGEVAEVHSFGTRASVRALRPGDEDPPEPGNVVTVLRFADGPIGVIDNSRAVRYGFDCRTEIVGSEGTLRIDAPRVAHVETLDARGSTRDYTSDFHQRFSGAYVAELQAFARTILADEEPSVMGEDGLAAIRLSLAAERSLRGGGGVAVSVA